MISKWCLDCFVARVGWHRGAAWMEISFSAAVSVSRGSGHTSPAQGDMEADRQTSPSGIMKRADVILEISRPTVVVWVLGMSGPLC